MTPDLPIVPAWVTADWNRHANQARQHFCAACQEYAVPREGAVCPCCDGAASFEGQMP